MRFAGLEVEATDAVKSIRVFFRRGITFAFLCKNMDENRAVDPAGTLENLFQRSQVMTVDRAQVGKAQLLEKNTGH